MIGISNNFRVFIMVRIVQIQKRDRLSEHYWTLAALLEWLELSQTFLLIDTYLGNKEQCPIQLQSFLLRHPFHFNYLYPHITLTPILVYPISL